MSVRDQRFGDDILTDCSTSAVAVLPQIYSLVNAAPLTPNSLLFIDCCSHVRLAMPLRNLDAKEVASLGRFMDLKPVFMPSFTTMSAPRTSLVGVTEGEGV